MNDQEPRWHVPDTTVVDRHYGNAWNIARKVAAPAIALAAEPEQLDGTNDTLTNPDAPHSQ